MSTASRLTPGILLLLLLGGIVPPSTAAESVGELKAQLKAKTAENARLRAALEEATAARPSAKTPVEPTPKIDSDSSANRLEPVATVLDRVILRQSVFDQKTFKNPAEITYVRPGSGPADYAIDAGLGFSFITYQRGIMQLDWLIGVDYHRNSNPAALQDIFQPGLVFDLTLGNTATDPFATLIKGSGSFKNDTVADLQSVEATLEVLPLWSPLRINSALRAGPLMAQWQPFGGLVYESATDTAANVEKGHRLLGRFGAEIEIFPLAKYIKDRLRLHARYTAWSTLDATGVYGGLARDEWSAYFEAGLSYFFFVDTPAPGVETAKQTRIGIGLTYQNGDDPELGLEDLDLLTLSLQAQF